MRFLHFCTSNITWCLASSNNVEINVQIEFVFSFEGVCNIESDIIIFADDTSLMATGTL